MSGRNVLRQWGDQDVQAPHVPWRYALRGVSLKLKHLVHGAHNVIWVLYSLAFLVGLVLLWMTSKEHFKDELTTIKYISVALFILYLVAIALRWLVPRDPLGYKHGAAFRFEPARSEHVRAIALIADAWFGSKQLGGRERRLDYIRQFVEAPAPLIWVLLSMDSDGEQMVIGYSSLLPVNYESYVRHYERSACSQYGFTPDDMLRAGDGVPDHPLYAQALALHPAVFGDAQARAAMKNMIPHHIAAMVLYLEPETEAAALEASLERLSLYAEEFSPGGRRFFESIGGSRTGSMSIDKHAFLVSELPKANPTVESLRKQLPTIIAWYRKLKRQAGGMLG